MCRSVRCDRRCSGARAALRYPRVGLLLALGAIAWQSPRGVEPAAGAALLAGQLVVARGQALGFVDAATRREESLPGLRSGQ
jgi:hypothetical protein